MKGMLAAALLLGASAPLFPATPYVMDQKDTQFVPRQLVVPRGATVAFENHDATEHNVSLAVPEAGKTVTRNLGTFPPGRKTSYTFEHPGVVHVHCNIHKGMTATIAVK